MQVQHQQLFDPPLPPEKVAAIDALGVGIVDKIYVHFEAAVGSESTQQPGRPLAQAVPTPVTSFAKVSKHMSSNRAAPSQQREASPKGSSSHGRRSQASIPAASIDQVAAAAEPASSQAQGDHQSEGSSNDASPGMAAIDRPASSSDQGSPPTDGQSSGNRLQPVVSYHLLWRDSNQYAQGTAARDSQSNQNAHTHSEESAGTSSQAQSTAEPDPSSAQSRAVGLPSWAKGLCNLRFGGSEFIKEAAAATPSAIRVRGIHGLG